MFKVKKISITAICLLLQAVSFGEIPWDIEELKRKPEVYKADGFNEQGVEGLFYSGVNYKESQTRIFAWIGFPTNPGGMAPAVVLVHGGGGTASAEWVRMWTQRGFVAIAPDTCGSVPDGEFPARKKHSLGGPDGWGGFDQIDLPITDQWMYHAVASVIIANSLLRSYNEVDRYNIGVVGVSWGGVISSTALAIDERFCFGAIIYGCGFLNQSYVGSSQFARMGRQKAQKWTSLWDPSNYLRQTEAHTLWVNGTNDPWFPLNCFTRSLSMVYDSQALVLPELEHSHERAWQIEEVFAFAEYAGKGADPPVVFRRQGVEGIKNDIAWVQFGPETMPEDAVLVYTTDGGTLKNRRWQQTDAEIDNIASTIKAQIPQQTKLYYFNATDKRGIVSSSRYRSAPN